MANSPDVAGATSNGSNRLAEIDVLRGLAALTVVIFSLLRAQSALFYKFSVSLRVREIWRPALFRDFGLLYLPDDQEVSQRPGISAAAVQPPLSGLLGHVGCAAGF